MSTRTSPLEDKVRAQSEIMDMIGKWLEGASVEGEEPQDVSEEAPAAEEAEASARENIIEADTEENAEEEAADTDESSEDEVSVEVDIGEVLGEILREIEPSDMYSEEELEEWRNHMLEMPDEALKLMLEEFRDLKNKNSELEKEVSRINALKETYPELSGILEKLEKGESLILAIAQEVDLSNLPRPGEEGWQEFVRAEEERKRELIERKQEIERLQAEILRNEELSRLKFENYRRKYGVSEEEARKIVALMDETLNNMIYRKIDERMLDVFTLAVRAPELLEQARKEGRKEAAREIAGKISKPAAQEKPPASRPSGVPTKPPIHTASGETMGALDSWARAIGEALNLPRTLTRREKGK